MDDQATEQQAAGVIAGIHWDHRKEMVMAGGVTGAVIQPSSGDALVDGKALVTNPHGILEFSVQLQFSGTPVDGAVLLTVTEPNGVKLLNPSPGLPNEIVFTSGEPVVSPLFSIPYGATASGLTFSATPIWNDVTGTAVPMTQPLRWIDPGFLSPSVAVSNYAEGDIPTVNAYQADASGMVTALVKDMSGLVVSGATVLMGAPDDAYLGSFVLKDVNGQSLTASGKLQDGSPAVSVTTGSNGVAAFAICPNGESAHAFAGFDAQVSGRFISPGQSQAGFVVADLKSAQDDSVIAFATIPAPSIEGAEGKNYTPQPGQQHCRISIKTTWEKAALDDKILIVVQDRPRAVVSVADCVGDEKFTPGMEITYTMQVQQLITGNNISLRFLVLRNDADDPYYSYYTTWNIGTLPQPEPVLNSAVCPAPRLFVKTIDASGNAALGAELLSDIDYIVGWNDIREGGIYAFIPYHASDISQGVHGAVTMTAYLNGERPGGNVVVHQPKQYSVTVGDNAVSPSGANLPHGALVLMTTDVLRGWERDGNGYAQPFQVQYVDASTDYSKVWNGRIDTVPDDGQ
ncbi:hypothetical protein KDW49_18310 [Burkholderia dolosa]|uniref:hypothetical protein n=1 Tax=Burkholderia dolosa TaxID=152500 RepID=UPI001B9CF697|nr:hypothetical protein [Burkholderia dolosa]MBR8302663.1 hypothetical protein [Burkholderia dolosa]MBR8314580.1 hypothetical protein [Burkholderia dolosa]MBY4833975.1 hypothetical protein [Burkholderia dolosa]